ncbi:hypothetical protein Q9299_03995 [Gemmobacter fulvus]|uniref:hypothetical protein n=1 Tax=Gemmobacter fulvus TaxID=2840474 RepID=UPI00279686AD|nr:hypothetical protein [Gemmobacter fulvus]MDQ1847440.1 hypothetical protein [Gemmobacter fulvus]
MRRIWDRAPLAIDAVDGLPDGPQADVLVLAFASIGHDPAQMPSPEFRRTAVGGQGRAALFVMDRSRSWGNTPDFAPAVQAAVAHMRQRQTIRRIVTLGSSMGGFCALVAASLLPVDVVLAFSPQFSVDPRVMPQENRWRDWTRAIDRFTHATAPLPQTRITLFHGAVDDLPQALAFPVQRGLDHLLFPDQTHAGLAAHLKARGVMEGLLEAALEDDRRRLLRIAASAGGRLRQRLYPA